MHTLNILSLNVNGLNSAVKRTRVLEYLHRKSISCALIQEIHLKQSDVARFQNKYYKLGFIIKTKGVLILVNMGGAREGLAGAPAPPRKTKAPP